MPPCQKLTGNDWRDRVCAGCRDIRILQQRLQLATITQVEKLKIFLRALSGRLS